jgi:uncharacterized membrane protein YfcA
MQTISQYALDLAYGSAIGAALGLTGTGGSILAVPTLVYLVGQDVHTAIGTSLAVVGGIAAEGAVEQQNSVQWKAGLLLGACGVMAASRAHSSPPTFQAWSCCCCSRRSRWLRR